MGESHRVTLCFQILKIDSNFRGGIYALAPTGVRQEAESWRQKAGESKLPQAWKLEIESGRDKALGSRGEQPQAPSKAAPRIFLFSLFFGDN